MDELLQILVDTQKEFCKSNKAKDKIIVLLIVVIFLETALFGSYIYTQSQYETVSTTTKEVDISTDGENANAEYNEVGGNQYNDSATHNQDKDK